MKALLRISALLFGLVVLVLPAGHAIAATNFVYLADFAGVIYRFDVAAGSSSVFTGSGHLMGAVGIVQETSGDLLVATVGTNTIWRINHLSKAITLLSANGLLKNPDLMGLVGNEVFVADIVAHSIIGVNTTTGAQRLVVQGGQSNGGPWMCSGPDGNLYVSVNATTRIVRVDPATGAEGVVSFGGLLSSILGITYGPDGFLYVCCSGVQRIVRVDPSTGVQTQVVQGGFGGNPYGISAGPDGYLWVGVEQSNKLVRVDPASGLQTTYTILGMNQPYGVQASGSPGPPPPPPSPPTSCSASDDRPDSVVVQWLAGNGQIDVYDVDRDGVLIATTPDSVLRYAERPAAGSHTYCVRARNTGGVSDPCCDTGQVTSHADQPVGTVYATDRQGTIHWLDVVTGQMDSSKAPAAVLNKPIGIVQEDEETFLVSSVGYDCIFRVNLVSGAVTTLSYRNRLRHPMGIALSGNEVFVADPGAGAIIAVNTATGAQRTAANGYASGGAWICKALDGFLYVSQNPNSRIVRLDPVTGYQTVISSGGLLVNIQGIACGPDGMLYVASYSTHSIVRVDPVTGAQGLVSQGDNLVWPLGVGAAPDSSIWVTGDLSHVIVRVDPVDGSQIPYSMTNMWAPEGILPTGPIDLPVPALLQSFDAVRGEQGVMLSADFAGDLSSCAIRLWRSPIDSRLGAVPLTPGATPLSGSPFEFLDAQAPPQKLWYWADLVSQGGAVSEFGPVTVAAQSAFPSTILLAPKPNPSTSSVDFAYTIGNDQGSAGSVLVHLVLFDTRGKLVRVLASGSQPVGHYQVHWDGNDQHGVKLGTGVYQYRLQVGALARSGKVIRI